ncbi:MAG: crossover junction endodeoxyribonuclease RuvC [Candidatus Levybacteria bacterium]|nr:crossover junction endodeoxyribonuclease RuvC [Candidatus Levybacteria bacterium]
MRVLGIDPGIGRLGWGIVDVNGGKLKAEDYGCIETEPNSDTSLRLLEISNELSKIFKRYKPDVMAIEELFFGANSKTALVVGQARGVVFLVSAQNKIPVFVYTPLQVKMALTGYGRADKNQISQMVKIVLKLEKIPKLDDTSDALAVAVSHALSSKMNSQTKL